MLRRIINMRSMRFVLWIFLIASSLGFFASTILEKSYEAKAQKVQIVRIDHQAKNPLGQETVDVGVPALLIVEDDRPFLKNKTPLGLPMIDVETLHQKNGSIIRLETIQSVTALARVGCLLTICSMIFGLIIVRRLSAWIPPIPRP